MLLINKISAELEKLQPYDNEWDIKVRDLLSFIPELAWEVYWASDSLMSFLPNNEKKREMLNIIDKLQNCSYKIRSLASVASECIPRDEVPVVCNIKEYVEKFKVAGDEGVRQAILM